MFLPGFAAARQSDPEKLDEQRISARQPDDAPKPRPALKILSFADRGFIKSLRDFMKGGFAAGFIFPIVPRRASQEPDGSAPSAV
jgi:hypothetical protein